MSQKTRKFKKTYLIVFEGRSRGVEGELTFMEEMIDNTLGGFIDAFKSFYRGVKVTFKENKNDQPK